jgi:TatD DNase family protein
MIKLYDAHTHVNFSAFNDSRKDVVDRALAAGVGMINVGTQRDTSLSAVKLAEEYKEGVYAIIGLHPIHTSASYHDEKELGGDKGFTSRGEEFDSDYYEKLAENKKVVGIGECGLDYFRTDVSDKQEAIKIKKSQEKAFRAQIELAQKINKPLMVHCRSSQGTDDAYEDALHQLSISDFRFPMIFHFFAGSPAVTKKILGLPNTYFTFGGVITFARDYDEIISMIPIEKIMLETDAPYVTPAPHRGKRNEPAFVVEVAKKMAELKGVDYDKICTVTTKTIKNVFKI